MKRIKEFNLHKALIISIIVIAIFGSYVLATDSTSSNPTDTTEWPMFGRSLNHTSHYSANANTYTITPLWNYTIGGNISDTSIINSISVANGMVYFGTHGDNKSYALNATTGISIWNYTGKSDNQISSAAGVVGDVVYMGSAAQRVFAINATTGVSIWNFTTGANIDYSSAAVSNSIVYIGDISNKLYAINATNGNQLWTYTTGGRVDSSPAVVNGVVYVGSDDFSVYALNATNGSLIWSHATGGAIRSSPVFSSDIIYVISLDNKTYALNATTGTHIWNYTTEAYRNNTPDTDIFTSTPAVANGIIYIATSNQKTYALNATTGTHIWNYTTANTSNSPIIANNVLIMAISDTIHILNATTGTVIINYTKTDTGFTSPSFANNILYAYGGNSIVYAYNLTADSTPPIRSAGSPTGTVTTSSTTLSVTTDETATCKYDTSSGVAYASMTNSFSDSGTSHTASISGLSDGSYTYYVKCQDNSGNSNLNDYTISFTVSIPGTCVASGSTDCATVDISISSQTLIDISPNSFSFGNIQVGTFGTSKSATIENIGSNNVTKLSIDVAGSYGPGFSPTGSGTVSNVGTGDVVLASTDDITYGYLQSSIATNEIMPAYVVNSANLGAKGRFRFTEYEYFWEVATGNTTGGGATATCGNGTLKYFNTTGNAHNRSQQGGVNVAGQSGVTLSLNAPAADPTTKTDGWGFSDVTFNMPANDPYGYNTGYCFAIRQDCQVARIWKFNNNQGLTPGGIDAYDNASLCSKDTYLINDGSNGGAFKPGQLQNIYFNVAIPFGTANGSLLQSTITVRAL